MLQKMKYPLEDYIHRSSKRVINVRMKGLEPPSLAALDPKSSASTNFATSALCVKKNSEDRTPKRSANLGINWIHSIG